MKLLNLLDSLRVKVILTQVIVRVCFRLIFFFLSGPFIEIFYLDLSHFHSLTAVLFYRQIKFGSFCSGKLTTPVVASEIAELSYAFQNDVNKFNIKRRGKEKEEGRHLFSFSIFQFIL